MIKKAEVEDFTEFLLQKKNNTTSAKEIKFSFAKGMFTILHGFNDPIEGMEKYMK